ncbi:Endo-1,4-beta-xylanase A precursor [compost metagenome]
MNEKLKRWVSVAMMVCLLLGLILPAGYAAELGQGLQISHTAPSSVQSQQDYLVEANITGGSPSVTGAVYYSIDGGSEQRVSLAFTGTRAEGMLTGSEINGNELEYYIAASDDSMSLTANSATYKVTIQPSAPAAVPAVQSLMITELVPDTKNITDADAYEFVEVYNTTNEPIQLSHYYFYYNGKDKWTPLDQNIVIPARAPVVFWVMNGKNGELQASDFNSNFENAGLQEGVNLFRINGGGGMANGSARNLQIKSVAGDALITSASYVAADVKENKGIVFRQPAQGATEMEKMAQSGTIAATPGVVTEDQLTPEVSDVVITHTPLTSTDVQDLNISAAITYSGAEKPAQLLYKTPSQARFKAVSMKKSGSEYTAMIPASALVESKLEYKIAVKDTVEAYTVNVSLPAFDESKVPEILITEVVPNSTNVGTTGSDAYEFVELYNNTDQPIQFKNYKLYYRYPDKGAAGDVKWPTTTTDFVIPSQQTVTFWIQNSANSSYTVQDFNTFYGTQLEENKNLFIISSDGMANGSARGLVVKTNTEREISSAYYDPATTYADGSAGDETREDKALLYKYPVNGGIEMNKVSSGAKFPTPGVVEPDQVPSVPVHVTLDLEKPVVVDYTGVSEVDQSAKLDLKASAEDNVAVTSVEVFVASDKQPDFVKHNLSQDYNDTLYHFALSSADLIGRSYIEYYFVVSDGTNETQTDTKRITITGGPDHSPLRLNLKDGELVSGATTIKGTAEQAAANALGLIIDNNAISEELSSALEHDAYFVFEAKNVDYYFKNAVTMGPESLGDQSILYTFMDPITNWQTLSFPISADRLQMGLDNVIYIRAGSKSSPFDPRVEENKDDFEVKNVRLLLADGTEIWDSAYSARDKEIKMGDSAGKSESIGFRFNLQPELFKSLSYSWNTRNVADGEHTVAVKYGSDQVSSKVVVDNTAPAISATLKDGQEYRGDFTIDAEITDEHAGLDKVEVKLDGEVIQLPYATSSGKLSAGQHTLIIKASDLVGNEAEKTISFSVPDENPLAPELVSPADGQGNVGGNPELTVKVQDPSNDDMTVSFYKGFKYDGKHTQGFTGFKNASDTEPPKVMIPQGEEALTTEEYAKIGAVDGEYLVNDSVEQFPYQRYEVELDSSVKVSDRIDIEWKGHSLEGRKVSLYAWSPASQKWVQLIHRIAGTEDFELKATVLAGDYMIGNKIQVMVQDEIAAVEGSGSPSPVSNDRYDFSFIWMSDTQYYSQSFPYIYQKNVQWIVDNAQNMNVKYVIHTGDLVDKSYQKYQWEEADRNMKVLEDANIPYGVLAGNHDVGHQDNDYTEYWKYFGEERFKKMSTFAGSYENNRGHYDLVSAGGNDFIIVYMGWGLGDQEIEWMNEVVSKYPERKAILALHEYLLVSNNRAPIADEIFEKVVKPNKNVIAALSGHYHDSELKIDELDDDGDGVADRKVYQMLADYQGAPEGGLGYIRLLQFDMENNMLHVKTYSPYLDTYNFYDPVNFPDKDEFSLPLDLQPATKRVATDYIGIKVYSDQLIDVKNDVASGSNAAVVWKNLQKGYYQWYVKAEDQHSGSVLSDIWGFYTGEVNNGGNNGGDSNSSGSGSGTSSNNGGSTSSNAVVKDGVIELSPSKDGGYHVDSSAMKKAVEEGKQGTIEIKLNGSAAELENLKLAIEAEGLQLVKNGKLTLKVIAPSVGVVLPAMSLPDNLSDADEIVLRVDITNNAAVTAAVSQYTNQAKEFTATGLVYTLSMVKMKGQQETAIHQFNGPVTIERQLSADQQKAFDPQYAGVYYLNGTNTEYLGGTFDGNVVRFTTDHFSEFAILEYHKQFDDLAKSWAKEYILKLTAKHIITGVDAHRYAPNMNVTRADFAVLAVRALGLETGNAKASFTDVSQDAYYASYIAKAAELGLVQGSDGKFRPKDTITREEAAVILVKLGDLMKASTTSTSSSSSLVKTFEDFSKVSSWAKDSVTKAQSLGLVQGKGGNEFDPQGHVTRAEIAKMLYTLLNIQ